MIFIWWLAACAASAVLGYWAAGYAVQFLRKKAKPKRHRAALIFCLGATERAVATTLVIFAPPYLPAFIGGWIALKFAVGWQRYKKEKPETGGAMVALIGNVVSFTVAIAVGLIINPSALTTWATTSH